MDGQKEKYNGFIKFYFLMCDGWNKVGIEFLFFKEPGRNYSEHAIITEEGDYLIQIPIVLPEELKDRSWKKKHPELQGVLEEKVKELFPYAMKKYRAFLEGLLKRAETLGKIGPFEAGSFKDDLIRVIVI